MNHSQRTKDTKISSLLQLQPSPTGNRLWLDTMIWQTAVSANERVPMWKLNDRPGDSLGRNENMPYQLDHRNPWIQYKGQMAQCDFSTGLVGSIVDCAAEFWLFIAANFSFPFFLSLFWSSSNCAQPVIRAWLKQTEAKGQQCVLSTSTERQINGLLKNWAAMVD